jgi:hypothetical protein
MKNLILLVMSLAAATAVQAGFKVPKNVHTPLTLEAAKTEAGNEKKAIAVLLSNSTTT